MQNVDMIQKVVIKNLGTIDNLEFDRFQNINLIIGENGYINMSEKDLEEMDTPKNYKKRDSGMNDWLNIIFKMVEDYHWQYRFSDYSNS